MFLVKPDRRIAQWQSASKYTEEAARFESCSAYQPDIEILFLSHCVPNPPDKGERIRAFHLLRLLADQYGVHLFCFARTSEEMEHAQALTDCCRSVYVELLPPKSALITAAAEFVRGKSLVNSFYASRRMRQQIESKCTGPVAATVAFSSAMAQYAPAHIPLLLDMVDVDSEKWFDYARMRQPAFLYRMEARRFRRIETDMAHVAQCTFFATDREQELFRSFAPDVPSHAMENGVDFAYFDPAAVIPSGELQNRRPIVFVGAMDYYPNVDAVTWFSGEVFSRLREADPDLEFFIVGRNPSDSVRALGNQPGVLVTGDVPDVRPFIAAAQVCIAPLRIARGIQNKVLEALAMGKHVCASAAVCETFGPQLPVGVSRCDTSQAYMDALKIPCIAAGSEIRLAAQRRFCWRTNLQIFAQHLDGVINGRQAAAAG